MKELLHGSPPPAGSAKENFPKKGRSFLKKAAIRILPVSVFIFAGCSGGGVGEKNTSSQELEKKESSGYSLPFPQGETWFLTTGPHADGLSNGIKYAIDIAPPELGSLNGNCPTDGSRLSIDNRVVTASASGQVVLVGKDNDRNDPFHSVVDIEDKSGLTQVYIHLDNTRVKAGDKIKQGEVLGNPSCEFPPGGRNTGPHVHVGLMKNGQPIPIDGIAVGGWTIHNGVDGRDGTMTKPGEKTRTASTGRYGENSTGIRNDLPNNPNRAVVASPKDPIPPISATITSKEVLAAAATPTLVPIARPTATLRSSPTPTLRLTPTHTPTPTETPKPAVEKKVSVSKKPDELYRALLTSPIAPNVLPQGMSLGGISAGEIDATGKALKQIGAVNILIKDPNFTLAKEFPNGAIFYGIFPDASAAKSASEVIGTHFGDGQVLKDFPYPTKIYNNAIGFAGTTTVLVASVENVTVIAFLTSFSLTGTDSDLMQSRTTSLAHAAIEHLGKVGR